MTSVSLRDWIYTFDMGRDLIDITNLVVIHITDAGPLLWYNNFRALHEHDFLVPLGTLLPSPGYYQPVIH